MLRVLIICLYLLPFSVSSQTVYKTPSGKKYHLSTCRMVNNVSTEISIAEAIQLGLTACKICNPNIQESAIVENRAQGTNPTGTVQCKGMTKKGTRCQHMTRIANGYCFQHNPDKNKP